MSRGSHGAQLVPYTNATPPSLGATVARSLLGAGHCAPSTTFLDEHAVGTLSSPSPIHAIPNTLRICTAAF
jgi:hypothetical protein